MRRAHSANPTSAADAYPGTESSIAAARGGGREAQRDAVGPRDREIAETVVAVADRTNHARTIGERLAPIIVNVGDHHANIRDWHRGRFRIILDALEEKQALFPAQLDEIGLLAHDFEAEGAQEFA